MERLHNWLPEWLDLRTAAFTITSILLGLCAWWALRECCRGVRKFFFNIRAYGSLLGHMDCELKIIKQTVNRLEFALNRDVSSPRPSLVPPPLDLNPTLDATDWLEDDKKTEIR